MLLTVGLSILFSVNLARNAAVAAGQQLEVSLALDPAVLPAVVGTVSGALVVGLAFFVRGLKVGGAFSLAATAAMIAGPAAVLAQSANPAASPAADGSLTGKYVVVRFRQFKAGQDIAAAQKLISEGFVPLNQAVPGFVSCFVMAAR